MEHFYRILLAVTAMQTTNSQLFGQFGQRRGFHDNFGSSRGSFQWSFGQTGNTEGGAEFRRNSADDPVAQPFTRNQNVFRQTGFPSFIRRNGDDPPAQQSGVNGFGQFLDDVPVQGFQTNGRQLMQRNGQQFSHDQGPNTDWGRMLHESSRLGENENIFIESSDTMIHQTQTNKQMRRSGQPMQVRSSQSLQNTPTSRGPRPTFSSTSRTDPTSGTTSWSWSWQFGSTPGQASGTEQSSDFPGFNFNNWGQTSGTSNFRPTPTPSTSFSRVGNSQTGQTSTSGQSVQTGRFTSEPSLTTKVDSKTTSQNRGTSNTPITSGSLTPGSPSSTGSTRSASSVPSTAASAVVTSHPALGCTEEYQKLSGHTLCMTDDPRARVSGVSPENQAIITDLHNELRGGVVPPAEDLLPLTWDPRLAAVAEKWAKQCTLGHDKERRILDLGMSVGQNVAVGYYSWQEAVRQWYNEISMYRYGFEPDSYLGPGGWREVAHFTQIVQNGTTLIGCGYAECLGTQYLRYYVCNYASGQSNLAYPYTAGTRCGSCPNNCFNGLCDCGGKVCLNKGVMDLSTCTCNCPRLYKGATCEILDCPADDRWICGRDWPPQYCEAFSNIPEECPFMCGICKGSSNSPGGQNWVNMNQTFTSAHGCTYTGRRSSQEECQAYGRGGDDMSMCESQGGTVGCDQCQRFYNIKRDYCPVQCGLCDPPCGGKRCSNGGTLDTATCSCTCKPPFQGSNCEYAACPLGGDPRHCQFWPQRFCGLYYNVPEECPYKCGICQHSGFRVDNNSNSMF